MSVYHFGPFRLDSMQRMLLREGRIVPLPAKVLSTLLVLVRNGNHLVEKNMLIDEVWPEEFVEEGNLAQHIYVLRKALGETSDGDKYIETVPRRGYRFLKGVRETNAPINGVASGIRGQRIDEAVRSHSLAVVPFVNAAGDAELDHFADSLTDKVINSLSRVPEFHVAARNSVLHYRGKEMDARRVGHELGVRNVLLGKVRRTNAVVEVSTELVDVDGGWQLYGSTRTCRSDPLSEVQDEIASELSAALRIRFSQEQYVSKRHTENSEAYQAYLKGRYCWSKYTTEGLEEAIRWFQHTIDLDPGFALAYAAIVDCYLRLATNYIPPAGDPVNTAVESGPPEVDEAHSRARGLLEVRREWDLKSAERECKRAVQLQTRYPAAHQWYSAYIFARRLYEDRAELMEVLESDRLKTEPALVGANLLDNIQSSRPTPTEEAQVLCTVAREQIDAGNYEAARLVLEPWWTLGEWPKLDGLSPHVSADLLFTAGSLAGHLASTRQLPKGQKHAEALLNGSIALFEQFTAKKRSAEGRIELALCYKREGLFDLSRATLLAALKELSEEGDRELNSVGLIRLASLEREAGCFHDAHARLNEAADIVESAGPWATGRYYLELASTFRELATVENCTEYLDRAFEYFAKSVYEFEATGNHRLAAIVENNYGYLLLTCKRLDEAEDHLVNARRLFDSFGDKVRCAQVDETMAQLHLSSLQFELAEQVIMRSVKTLEMGGEDTVLAESLRTQGVVLCRLGRFRDAQRTLERAQQVAERCGDVGGAQRAHLIMTGVAEQLSQELERYQQKLFALEKHTTEGGMADGVTREMLKLLVGARVVLEQALGFYEREPGVSLSTPNRGARTEIYDDLKAGCDKDNVNCPRPDADDGCQ